MSRAKWPTRSDRSARCPGRARAEPGARAESVRRDARTTREWSRRNRLRSAIGQPGTVPRSGRPAARYITFVGSLRWLITGDKPFVPLVREPQDDISRTNELTSRRHSPCQTRSTSNNHLSH